MKTTSTGLGRARIFNSLLCWRGPRECDEIRNVGKFKKESSAGGGDNVAGMGFHECPYPGLKVAQFAIKRTNPREAVTDRVHVGNLGTRGWKSRRPAFRPVHKVVNNRKRRKRRD